MRARSILLGSIFASALVLSSFWLGFRNGTEVALLVDAAPRGSISLHHLEGLRHGVTKNMFTGLERDIDIALLYADQIEKNPLYPILESVWGLPVSSASQSLVRLANYRKSHPSPLRAAALSAEPLPTDPVQAAAVREVLNGAEQNDVVIAHIVQKYATKEVKQ